MIAVEDAQVVPYGEGKEGNDGTWRGKQAFLVSSWMRTKACLAALVVLRLGDGIETEDC